jgi:hypothetical protein
MTGGSMLNPGIRPVDPFQNALSCQLAVQTVLVKLQTRQCGKLFNNTAPFMIPCLSDTHRS